MPTYDYLCTQCKLQFETRHSINAPNPDCFACGGGVEKIIISAPATLGNMARGRDMAIHSLQPKNNQVNHVHGPGCGCVRHQNS
ncbi:FmdB family zinc ribbon protein [Nitrosomonas supralitoralis]|uniref:Zinc ribbon domain-containing protein n=1 Tax=Nitrosomonas supralitoralis TaxID=2116706 RepID=A0A2P7NUZ3_9PROT|nr:zinc ribbon domain-containing protein [Nitrosomonas supralitoralis]PSJ17294.1 zinc ribbon domain-containing protein [Nitrosomonas supralitoralis]